MVYEKHPRVVVPIFMVYHEQVDEEVFILHKGNDPLCVRLVDLHVLFLSHQILYLFLPLNIFGVQPRGQPHFYNVLIVFLILVLILVLHYVFESVQDHHCLLFLQRGHHYVLSLILNYTEALLDL